MEEVSLLYDEFEQLPDPGPSMATEVVEEHEWQRVMLHGKECNSLASHDHLSRFEQSLCW